MGSSRQMDTVAAGQWQETSRLLPPELASALAAQTGFGAHGLHSQVGKRFPEAITILKRRLQLMVMRVQRGNLLFRFNTSLQVSKLVWQPGPDEPLGAIAGSPPQSAAWRLTSDLVQAVVVVCSQGRKKGKRTRVAPGASIPSILGMERAVVLVAAPFMAPCVFPARCQGLGTRPS